MAAWGISAKQLLIEAAASAAVRLSFAPQASPNIWCRSWFDALGYYAEATALAEETGELQLLFPCHDGLATLYLDLDEPEQAERYMCKAKEICERAGIDLDSRMVLPYLA